MNPFGKIPLTKPRWNFDPELKKIIETVAGQFDSPARAILTRCKQSGIQLRADGGNLKLKGNRETIAAWQALIKRHKQELLKELTGQPSGTTASDCDTLAADYEELTTCIIELCQLAGYSDAARDRMLAARQGLYPFQYAAECAYFRLQVLRAKSGTYFDALPF